MTVTKPSAWLYIILYNIIRITTRTLTRNACNLVLIYIYTIFNLENLRSTIMEKLFNLKTNITPDEACGYFLNRIHDNKL